MNWLNITRSFVTQKWCYINLFYTRNKVVYIVCMWFNLVWFGLVGLDFRTAFREARVHHQHIIFISQNGNEHRDALQNRPDMRHRYILINKSAGAISNATPDDWCLMCNWRKSYPLMAIKYEYSYVALLRTNNSPKNMRSFLPLLVVARHGFLIRFECLFLVSMSFYHAHSIRFGPGLFLSFVAVAVAHVGQCLCIVYLCAICHFSQLQSSIQDKHFPDNATEKRELKSAVWLESIRNMKLTHTHKGH